MSRNAGNLMETDYSVIVPVYNSSAMLPELFGRIDAVFAQLDASYQIVAVNDCSIDDSWEVLKAQKEKFGAKLTAVCLRKNTGQHNALLCGFQFAGGRYIITIDDDLQFYPEDIPLLIARARQSGADLVYGSYQGERQHSFLRKAGSRFVALIFEKFGNTVGQGSSFKLIHHSVIDKIKHYNHSYTLIDEMLAWHTMRTDWQEVRHAPRQSGKSGYSLFRLVFITLQLILGYTSIPLRFMTWYGLISFFVSLFFAAYFVYMKFTYGAVFGFTALIVTIFMTSGLILFSLGIIGEYLSRLLALSHRKPPFLIQDVLR